MRPIVDKLAPSAILLVSMAAASALAGEAPDVACWGSEAGKALRARMPADADYWQL